MTEPETSTSFDKGLSGITGPSVASLRYVTGRLKKSFKTSASDLNEELEWLSAHLKLTLEETKKSQIVIDITSSRLLDYLQKNNIEKATEYISSLHEIGVDTHRIFEFRRVKSIIEEYEDNFKKGRMEGCSEYILFRRAFMVEFTPNEEDALLLCSLRNGDLQEAKKIYELTPNNRRLINDKAELACRGCVMDLLSDKKFASAALYLDEVDAFIKNYDDSFSMKQTILEDSIFINSVWGSVSLFLIDGCGVSNVKQGTIMDFIAQSGVEIDKHDLAKSCMFAGNKFLSYRPSAIRLFPQTGIIKLVRFMSDRGLLDEIEKKELSDFYLETLLYGFRYVKIDGPKDSQGVKISLIRNITATENLIRLGLVDDNILDETINIRLKEICESGLSYRKVEILLTDLIHYAHTFRNIPFLAILTPENFKLLEQTIVDSVHAEEFLFAEKIMEKFAIISNHRLKTALEDVIVACLNDVEIGDDGYITRHNGISRIDGVIAFADRHNISMNEFLRSRKIVELLGDLFDKSKGDGHFRERLYAFNEKYKIQITKKGYYSSLIIDYIGSSMRKTEEEIRVNGARIKKVIDDAEDDIDLSDAVKFCKDKIIGFLTDVSVRVSFARKVFVFLESLGIDSLERDPEITAACMKCINESKASDRRTRNANRISALTELLQNMLKVNLPEEMN